MGEDGPTTGGREVSMFVVLFAGQPRADRWDEYLDTAKVLRPELEQIDGFLDNERYRSRNKPGWLLSLSTWRNEKALIRWRTQALHHAGQERGRFEIFADYHLRVGEVVFDSAGLNGPSLRQDRFDTTEVGEATLVSVLELDPTTAASPAGPDGELPVGLESVEGLVSHDHFESIYTPGKTLWLLAWRDDAARQAWQSRQTKAATLPANGVRRRLVRIIRDYGRFDRREAPQYYPPVEN